MNQWTTKAFEYPETPIDRVRYFGKVSWTPNWLNGMGNGVVIWMWTVTAFPTGLFQAIGIGKALTSPAEHRMMNLPGTQKTRKSGSVCSIESQKDRTG